MDTNIIIDLIVDRKPFSKYALAIFSLAEKKKIQLFVSSHSIATTYYILTKFLEEKELKKILYDLLDFVQVVQIDADMLRQGLKSKHKDFEDVLQMLCAYSIGNIDCIVTRNLKDFKDSEILVLPPEKVLDAI